MARQSRQIILLAAPGENGATRPLGAKRDVLKSLLPFNTGQDGSNEGFSTAHGPGIRMEFPFVDEKDPVNQVMVTILEDDYAWPVLARMCKELHWVMMDPESGRTFGA